MKPIKYPNLYPNLLMPKRYVAKTAKIYQKSAISNQEIDIGVVL